MIVRINMKNPDAVDQACEDAAVVAEEGGAVTSPGEVKDMIKKWVKYGEYIMVEIDTEKGTAVVVPV